MYMYTYIYIYVVWRERETVGREMAISCPPPTSCDVALLLLSVHSGRKRSLLEIILRTNRNVHILVQ